MTKFRSKPEEVEAFYFTGSKTSAIELVKWIKPFMGDYYWSNYRGRSESFNLGSDIVYTKMEELRELTIYRANYDSVLYIQPGTWLVYSSDGAFRQMGDDSFRMKYEEIVEKEDKTEEWRRIPGFDTYDASDRGMVRIHKTGEYVEVWCVAEEPVMIKLTRDDGLATAMPLYQILDRTFPEGGYFNRDKT